MNLLTDNLKKIYTKYLLASFGGAILQSVYGIVDMIVVGKYHGSDGSAAMALIAPIWNVIYSLGLLTGIGASILFSVSRSSEGKDKDKANGFFTSGLILTSIISVVVWILIFTCEDSFLRLLRADDTLFALAKQYLIPVKFAAPVFLFMQFMSAFLRNDNNPVLSTKAVVAGGVFNVFGDIFFVFGLDMGILGAGLATCLGATISLSVMLLHFRSNVNTLRLVKPRRLFYCFRRISTLGFSTFFIDLAVGLLTIIINIQVMKNFGSATLAVFGIIINVAIFVQCCGYGVGQASQPILSVNYGAGKMDRVRKLFYYNVITTAVISAVWVGLCMAFPQAFIYIFMKPDDAVLQIGPSIIRTYSLAFIFVPFNIYTTYFYQSILKPHIAFVVSLARGLVLSGLLIVVLPMLFVKDSIWLAIPLTEAIVFIYIVIKDIKYLRVCK